MSAFFFFQVRQDEMRGDEERVEQSTSFRNVPEALLVAQTVARLVAAGVAADSIGVVSPYSSQVLRQHPSACVNIHQNTSAYVGAHVGVASAYVRTRQHPSTYVRIRQHT